MAAVTKALQGYVLWVDSFRYMFKKPAPSCNGLLNRTSLRPQLRMMVAATHTDNCNDEPELVDEIVEHLTDRF